MKILIAQIGHYGDAALVTPMLRAIRDVLPSARVHMLAARRNAALLRSHPLAERVWTYDKRPIAVWRLVRALRRERFDWHIDPKDHYSRESALLARLAGARRSVGFNPPEGGQAFEFSVPTAEENNVRKLHCVQRNLQALAPLGVQTPETPPRPELCTEPDSERFVAEFCASAFLNPALPLVVANVSAGDAGRYWCEGSWKTLLAGFDAKACNVALNGVPADVELMRSIALAAPEARVFPSRSIMDAVSLVKAAALVVTPDTAIIHIAAAFDAPCVALYNALEWNYHKFYPLGARVCGLLPPAGSASLADIPPTAVWAAIGELGFEQPPLLMRSNKTM